MAMIRIRDGEDITIIDLSEPTQEEVDRHWRERFVKEWNDDYGSLDAWAFWFLFCCIYCIVAKAGPTPWLFGFLSFTIVVTRWALWRIKARIFFGDDWKQQLRRLRSK